VKVKSVSHDLRVVILAAVPKAVVGVEAAVGRSVLVLAEAQVPPTECVTDLD